MAASEKASAEPKRPPDSISWYPDMVQIMRFGSLLAFSREFDGGNNCCLFWFCDFDELFGWYFWKVIQIRQTSRKLRLRLWTRVNRQKRCQPILSDFKRFWAISNDFERFQTIFSEFGRFQTILSNFKRFERLQTILSDCKRFWNFGRLWNYEILFPFSEKISREFDGGNSCCLFWF